MGGYETAIAKITVSASTSPTTTALAASPNPVGSGKNVTMTATVRKSSGSGTPTGSVTFKTGSTSLATIPLNGSGVASLTAAANYPTGTYPITAYYSGDSNDAASNSNTVQEKIVSASTVLFTITPSSVKSGSNVTLAVKVTGGSSTPTGSVSFAVGSDKLFTASLNNGSISQTVSTTGYPAGTYTVTASYSGDSTHAAASTNASVTLTK